MSSTSKKIISALTIFFSGIILMILLFNWNFIYYRIFINKNFPTYVTKKISDPPPQEGPILRGLMPCKGWYSIPDKMQKGKEKILYFLEAGTNEYYLSFENMTVENICFPIDFTIQYLVFENCTLSDFAWVKKIRHLKLIALDRCILPSNYQAQLENFNKQLDKKGLVIFEPKQPSPDAPGNVNAPHDGH